jgi:hypothetical protein
MHERLDKEVCLNEHTVPVHRNAVVLEAFSRTVYHCGKVICLATGDRLHRGGHITQSDPRAKGPHGHRPGVTTPDGNPHLPAHH